MAVMVEFRFVIMEFRLDITVLPLYLDKRMERK